MAPGIAEVRIRLPHLLAVDRLPALVVVGSLTLRLTGRSVGAPVVGSLRAHVAEARWDDGRRGGSAAYEMLRTHGDTCTLTVVLRGRDCETAHAVALELRRLMTDGSASTVAPPRQRRLPTAGQATGHSQPA